VKIDIGISETDHAVIAAGPGWVLRSLLEN
jgi:hypothetical protein